MDLITRCFDSYLKYFAVTNFIAMVFTFGTVTAFPIPCSKNDHIW